MRDSLPYADGADTVRYVEAPTRGRGRVLEAGNQLMIPLRQLGHADEIWGSRHGEFDAARFVRDKGLAGHTAYRPFGGGAWLCPAKKYAARQVVTCVAYMFHMYEMDVPMVDGKAQCFPRNEHENLMFGVSVPKRGMDPRIEMRLKAEVRVDRVNDAVGVEKREGSP
jgi:hypothetical protein